MPPLRICAYNVLAQTLATSSFFPYASPHLKKATRLPLILSRIAGLDPDVLCISEAFPEVVAQLEAKGYGVVFKSRAGRPYGICLAWRAATLECLHAAALDLDDVAEALQLAAAAPQAAALAPDVFRTNSLALFAALRFRGAAPAAGGAGGGSGSSFCVGTTHLFWDPRLEAVKATQAVALKLSAAEFAAQHCAGRPLLLGGDFNSMPGSWVCRVLEGAFPAPAGGAAVQQWDVLSLAPRERSAEGAQAWLARLQAQLQAELGAPVPERLALPPALPGAAGPSLRSLYATARGAAGEPEITTCTATFAACIDFIYALEGSLDLAPAGLRCTPLPTKAELGGPIPSATEPSDHLPLCVELQV